MNHMYFYIALLLSLTPSTALIYPLSTHNRLTGKLQTNQCFLVFFNFRKKTIKKLNRTGEVPFDITKLAQM